MRTWVQAASIVRRIKWDCSSEEKTTLVLGKVQATPAGFKLKNGPEDAGELKPRMKPITPDISVAKPAPVVTSRQKVRTKPIPAEEALSRESVVPCFLEVSRAS